MKPENNSNKLLSITRSKAKMYEFNVPSALHIKLKKNPNELLVLTIGIVGELAALINNEGISDELLTEYKSKLEFSAQFFDTFNNTKIDKEATEYLLLLGSSAYILCDLQGSSMILSKEVNVDKLNLRCNQLDYLLHRLLVMDFNSILVLNGNIYDGYIIRIIRFLSLFYDEGESQKTLLAEVKKLTTVVYNNGNSRELLFIDIIGAIIKKRLKDSVWNSLPKYTGIDIESWYKSITEESFIKELWPAQRLLGERNVYKGQSATVQMPTSAGKTKSIEIIIRSAFLSGRASLSIVVAPFRSLCNEISRELAIVFRLDNINVNQMSDVFSMDFDISHLLNKKTVLIVTPEKLLYILRRAPEIGREIGLLIYDEGHQFDNGRRGITYELLLTSLKSMVSKSIQTILISAVISNAEEIGSWLNGETGEVITGTYLTPTYKNLAFVSWSDHLGRLEYVDLENPEESEYFVPRIIEKKELNLKKRERKKRYFPDENKISSIAGFLGLKLVPNGSVAIFAGTRINVNSLVENIVDAFDRKVDILSPANYSDEEEIKKIYNLYVSNLGVEAIESRAAILGIFTHHGSTPNGIRLAIEYGMKENSIKFVVCTSTLAQGVNLPIKYLILSTMYQGANKIKVRDFQNLIGRVARSGIHTEGSIIFADPKIYDGRKGSDSKWRWTEAKKLLNEKNSEPIISTLDSFFRPLYSDNRKSYYDMDPLDFTILYYENKKSIKELASELAQDDLSENGLTRQINEKMNIIHSIESYLMSLISYNDDLNNEDVSLLAKDTLAYSIGDEVERKQIEQIFKLLFKSIKSKISDENKIKIFGKTLLGVDVCIDIEEWSNINIESIRTCHNLECLLIKVWPIIKKHITNDRFNKISDEESLLRLFSKWSQGASYKELYDFLLFNEIKLHTKLSARKIQLMDVIDICDNAFSYDASLILSALIDIIELIHFDEEVSEKMKSLQQSIKYGLPVGVSSIYEIGFSDRVISQEIYKIIGEETSESNIISNIKRKSKDIRSILEKYPTYYKSIFTSIVN